MVDTPSLAVVDGKFGYGQTVTPQAVRIGIEKCKKAGLAAVALRNAGHIGRVGDWAEMAAAEGLVSVHFVNAAGSLLVAPLRRRREAAVDRALLRRHSAPGAGSDRARFRHLDRRRRQGAGRKPRRQEAAEGRADRCRRHVERGSGRALRAVHAEGPRDHTKGTGAIRAFGEHKGSGLAFICELLGGALTGTGATAPDRRFANGMLAFYIDPKVVDTCQFLRWRDRRAMSTSSGRPSRLPASIRC